MAKKTIPQTPDQYVSADFEQLFDRVFGPSNAPHNAEEIKEAIGNLSVCDLVAFRAYLGYRENQFREVNALLSEQINAHDVSDFPQENTLFAVSDKDTSEPFGGVYVETVTDVSLSTSKAKVSTQVKDELKKVGLLNDDYTRTSVELKNQALFQAKKDGKLPASVSDLLTETVTTKRVSSYIPVPANVKEGK